MGPSKDPDFSQSIPKPGPRITDPGTRLSPRGLNYVVRLRNPGTTIPTRCVEPEAHLCLQIVLERR